MSTHAVRRGSPIYLDTVHALDMKRIRAPSTCSRAANSGGSKWRRPSVSAIFTGGGRCFEKNVYLTAGQ